MPEVIVTTTIIGISTVTTALNDSIITSLFKDHLLVPASSYPEWRASDPDYWIPGILLLCFSVFVYLRVQYRKKFNELLRLFFSNRPINQITRDEYSINSRVSLGLMLIFIFCTSFLIYHLNQQHKWVELSYGYEFLCFIKIATIVSLLFFAKVIVIRLLGEIFDKPELATEQVFHVFLFNQVLGLFLFPLATVVLFIPDYFKNFFIVITLVLTALIFAYRLLRGFGGYFTGSRLPVFYLFIYLCALEIIPLVVIIKMFVM